MWMINLSGVLLIALIVWWFWLYRPRRASTQAGQMQILVVNGVYQPAHIQLPAHQAVALEFVRRDASPCAGMVVFPQLQLSAELHLDQATRVELPPLPAGAYSFHCQMQMYRGVLLVTG